MFLQDAADDYIRPDENSYSSVVDITTTSAILFVVIASCFLVMLYKFMSYRFIEILVVIFCIGGIEVCSPLYHSLLFVLFSTLRNSPQNLMFCHLLSMILVMVN